MVTLDRTSCNFLSLETAKILFLISSNNGGRRFHHSDEKINAFMCKIAQSLNLKGHLHQVEGSLVFGPVDIEVMKLASLFGVKERNLLHFYLILFLKCRRT